MQRQAESGQHRHTGNVCPLCFGPFLRLQLLRRLILEPEREGQGMQKPLERWPPFFKYLLASLPVAGWGPLLLSEGQGRGRAAAWSGLRERLLLFTLQEAQLGHGSCPKNLLLPPHGGMVGGEAPGTPPQANM